MITVLLVAMVLSILSIGSISYATGGLNLSRYDQDWNAALAAAESGLDDYVLRLNQDGGYWGYSATLPPPDGNKAFTDWVPVPGPANGGQFRYTPDASTMRTDGAVKLTSTGRVGNATRTVRATLRRRNFLDYLYFTEYETLDPALYTGFPFTPAQAQVACAKHDYEGRDSRCSKIYFYGDTGRKDTVKGPLHTNDAINIYGIPHFQGDASTSWDDPDGKRWLDGTCRDEDANPTTPEVQCEGGSRPVFVNKGDPRYMDPLTMPPSNSQLRAEVDPAMGGTGCLYTGPTKIVLNSNGTMTVTSPYTNSTNPGCGGGSSATTVSLPPNGVVYVQSLPTSTSDPNYRSGCSGYPLTMPVRGDITPYSCRDGDVFVSGTLSGALTIGSQHNVVITADLKYKSGGSGKDVLGLVADNYVEVYNPIDRYGRNLLSSSARPKNIDAAIVAIQHSFRVQNYSRGSDLGTLSVNGAIAQTYRGAVGALTTTTDRYGRTNTVKTGYDKNYVYDKRLKYTAPPRFVDPIKSAWQIKAWAEIKSAY